MKSEIELGKVVLDKASRSIPKSRGKFRKAVLTPLVCSIMASLGIFGGISSLFIGLVCVVIHGIFASDRIFDGVGTILLIFAIPMILIGSVFLDEIKKEDK